MRGWFAPIAACLASPLFAQCYQGGIACGLVQQSDLAALQATIPTVSMTTPTCIADSPALGTIMNQFAPANHTHCSKIRKQRIVTVSTASYVWTFPSAFSAGIVPVCQGIVEDPANSATDSYNVEIGGVPTATSATFRIIRQSILLGVLSLNNTPGTVNLHLTCFEP